VNGFELGVDGPTRILVAIDGSDTSIHAGAYAAGMARRQGSHLIILYVAQMPGAAASMAATAGALVQTHDSIAAELRQQLEEALPRLGVKGTFIVRHGNPYTQVVQVAAELKVDAVVVGASTQSGHRFVGSLAIRLVRDAKWPITVVP
jgi:nucleotide-binding universal stress UspA family protein